MKRREQQGVALVVTLILLAIITIVVVAFLGVSQRNRSLTSTATDQINAQFMADAGLERAQAEAAARLLSQPEPGPVQMLVSTNFINWNGFDPAAPPAQRFFNLNYTRTPFDNVNQPAPGFGPIYDPSLGVPLAYDELMEVLTNLYFNPRPPVFVRTNPSPIFPPDFRFYLDLNRNGRFDATGEQFELDDNFDPVVLPDGSLARASLVGDPEWIGVLQHPDQPHSATNRFIGRYAYLVVPEGLTLDLNAAHNYAKAYAVPGGNLDVSMNSRDRFLRNSGVGTYEMNLAGFLVGLNTNLWPGPLQTGNPALDYSYNVGALASPNTGLAFFDAWNLLRYRHRADPFNEASARLDLLFSYQQLYGTTAADWVAINRIDEYANGPLVFNENLPLLEAGADDPTVSPWSGSPNPNRFVSLDELFDSNKTSSEFVERLDDLSRSNSTYNSGTYYRLLSQLGTESGLEPESFVPGLGVDAYTATNVNPILPYRPEDKINLNWDNRDLRNVAGINTNRTAAHLVPWEPLAFFTNVAARMLRSQEFRGTDGRLISLNNIRVWPTNDYDGAVHRILQVAANLYDAVNTTGLETLTAANQPKFPTVFRPYLRREVFTDGFGVLRTNIYIAGYLSQEDLQQQSATTLNPTGFVARANYWDLNGTNIVDLVPTAEEMETTPSRRLQPMAFGVPMVVGAKKGFPNFNEIAMETYLQVQRNLYLRRPTTTSRPNLTNEVYFLGISNVVAVEAWNSYQAAFPRDLLIAVEVDYDVSLLSTNVGAANNTILRRVGDQAGRPFAASSFASGLIDVPATGPNSWAGRGVPPTFSPGSFKIPLATNFPSLPNSVWFPKAPGFTKFQTATGSLTSPVSPAPGLSANEFFTPDWNIALTNRVRMVVVDKATSRIVDYVNLDRMTWSTNVIEAARLADSTSGRESVFARLFDMNRVGGGSQLSTPTLGSLMQIEASRGTAGLTVPDSHWENYNALSRVGQDKLLAIDAFRRFVDGGMPLYTSGFQNPVAPSGLIAQTPYSPAFLLRLKRSYQANDPLVHYTSYDMAPPAGTTNTELLRASAARALSGKPENIGIANQRYKPWGEGTDATATNPVFIDPLINNSDAWNFPDHKLPNVGWIGRVHRGTPWQTVYLKSISTVGYDPNTGQRGLVDNALALQNLVKTWYDSKRTRGAANEHGLLNYATPDKDWRFLDLFTVAPNANATRGQVSVNQFGEATWSAVLSGVIALTNSTSSGPSLARVHNSLSQPVIIQPGSVQLRRIVEGINQTRAAVPYNGQYLTRGDILAVPELSLSSPYLNQPANVNAIQHGISDVALERIPQQIMSLLRLGDPRVVVYAYGQALQPAPFSINLDPNYLNVVTNYQVTGEYATRSVVKFERLPPDPNFQNLTNQNRLRAVVLESKVLPPQ